MAIAASTTILILLLGLIAASNLIPITPNIARVHYNNKKKAPDPIPEIPGFQWPKKPVLISFWAAWCGPCVDELPDLQRFAGKQSDIHVLLVNIDEKDSDHFQRSRQLLLNLGHLNFEHIDSKARVFHNFGGQSLPAHFLFSEDKIKVWESHGAIPWNHTDVMNQLFSAIKSDSKKAREPDWN